MRNLDVDACLEFQQVFYDPKGRYTPYELVDDPETYWPLSMFGEVGSLLNAYCKIPRSLKDYGPEIQDEAVDVFLYQIVTASLVRPSYPELLDGLREDWGKPPQLLNDDRQLFKPTWSLMDQVSGLPYPENNGYTTEKFRDMFGLIKSIATYTTGKAWQPLINDAHVNYADIRTRPDEYTPDLRTKGAGYQDFNRLLQWVHKYEVPMPPNRIEFLGRMATLQHVQGWPY